MLKKGVERIRRCPSWRDAILVFDADRERFVFAKSCSEMKPTRCIDRYGLFFVCLEKQMLSPT
jgi:hypothetical protein